MKKAHFLGFSEEGFHHIRYVEWGESKPNEVPIICVHGLTRNGRDFDELAEYLSAHNRHVFCPDIVGRGDSDWLKQPLHYTHEQYNADMVTMIARTGAAEVDWIGTSMGGLIGMMLAAQPNSPIRRLVLNDVGAQVSGQGIARISRYAGSEPDFNNLAEAQRYFEMVFADMGPLTDTQWEHFTQNSVYEFKPGKFRAKVDNGVKLAQAKSKIAWQTFLHPLRAMEGSIFDVNLWHVWRNVNCPVFIIHGENSDILVPQTIQKMCDIHPITQVMTVKHAGHAPALMDPLQHEQILKWLA